MVIYKSVRGKIMGDDVSVKASPKVKPNTNPSNKDIKLTTTAKSEPQKDSFVSSTTIKNINVLLPDNSNKYSKTITFEVEKGHKPKILYSGANATEVHDKVNATLSGNLPSLDTDALMVKRMSTEANAKTEVYSVSVKKGWNVNFEIDGTKINYDAPFTENTPSLNVTPKDLKVSESNEAGFSRVITFNTDKNKIPYIAASGRKGKETFFNKIVDLSVKDSYEDDSVIIEKIKVTAGGITRNEYKIKVKNGWKSNFQIGNSNVNYNTPAIPLANTPTPGSLQSNLLQSNTPLPRLSSEDVLPYASSGDKKYSPKHSIFATSSQDRGCPVSYPSCPPSDLNIQEYAKSEGTNYSKLRYGVPIFREMSQAIADAKGKISVEEALVKAHKVVSKMGSYNPQFRIGDDAKCNPSQDFEVLFIVGSYYGSMQEKAFKLDAEVTKNAISTFYPGRCKHFETMDKPRRKEFMAMLEERVKSAKKNGRKLYLFYSGHGGERGHQAGVKEADKVKQGSKEFNFCINDSIYESEMKDFLNEHAKDIEVIIGIDACHGDAAVTATENEKQKEIFKCVA